MITKNACYMTPEELAIHNSAVTAGNTLYSTVATYLREGSISDAEWMFEDNDLVWC